MGSATLKNQAIKKAPAKAQINTPKPSKCPIVKLILVVPWIGPTLNKIWAGVHWSVRKEYADDAHKAVKISLGRDKPVIFGPVKIDYYPFIKGRRYDVTNYALTCKGIEDGLALCGVIENDSFKIVREVVIHQPVQLKTGQSFMRVGITQI